MARACGIMVAIRRLQEKVMAKLYFKYGAMGSSKTANALITKFNYVGYNMCPNNKIRNVKQSKILLHLNYYTFVL